MANAEAAAATYLKVKVDAGDCTQNRVEAKNWLAGWRGCHVRF